ncbi:Sulfoxide reductase heme-binding subunit YedZ [Rhodovastum atsumiense]|uniref:Sulfoxide reductase heme-binding subunit YedZ n=1 Tax=Rhodovastum atsumiense TaxID=504468 RepID=A0A5M6IW35_9PROT|nr:ferric reductase-like transmembrane domain-containing protein [Rhodovastum atsumiense]KAA5612431.1 sulfoxide reductase heme-binding subunit YedZ [Rhodovastum atsumiense]CAH2600338.1 Sulfoxide reductase heme-binding subunit YedZ [Rhodovastum atsumiense]
MNAKTRMAALAVWRDHAGRFSWLKAVVLGLVLCPGAELAVLWATQGLGPRPVTEVLHGLGEWTVWFLLLTLAVTPARTVFDWPRVVQLRRLLGLATAAYALAHLTLFCVDQKWRLGTVVTEIALRFYLAIGCAALVMLLVLAATSTDGWQKRLGRDWKRLHRLVFVLLPLALWHYFLQSKADVGPAVLATGAASWLVLWRVAPRPWRGRFWLLPLLALVAGGVAAGIEAAWYALANGAQAGRVLAANLDIAFGPRPAVQVAIWGGVVVVLALARRVGRRLGGARRPRGAGPLGAATPGE